MIPTPQAQAILLLTAPLGRADPETARPLSNSEWARFASWLKDRNLAPAALLDRGWRDVVTGWADPAISLVRLEALLNRGAALGFALEKWQRAGLWVLTRSDADYPARLKKRLRARAPAALFGCGNRRLLNAGGVAVVGSREADDNELRFASDLGRQAAQRGRTVVSGGARGIDQSAMLGALECEGTAIGVLADSLLRSATSTKYRKYLISKDLVLVTPFNPEARFHVGSAMSRNKYIYCLADSGVAVCSKPGRGGTWNGAVENLGAAWVPMWVRRNDSPLSGNVDLVRRGARWLPSRLGPEDLIALSRGCDVGDPADLSKAGVGRSSAGAADEIPTAPSQRDHAADPEDPRLVGPDFYRRFLEWMDVATASEGMRAEGIAERLDLKKAQVHAWLTRGIAEHRVRRLAKPVRYRAVHPRRRQALLLRGEE